MVHCKKILRTVIVCGPQTPLAPIPFAPLLTARSLFDLPLPPYFVYTKSQAEERVDPTSETPTK